MDESKIKQREYGKKSYWKNHEKNLERVRKYNAKKREENREEYNRKMREYNAANKERINLRRRERRLNDKDYADKVRERDRARDPEQRRNSRLKRDYGISSSEYSRMLEAQNHCCSICGSKDADSLGRNFHVDHCHESGTIRGLLCSECNTGLGKFKDSAELLYSALKYLKG